MMKNGGHGPAHEKAMIKIDIIKLFCFYRMMSKFIFVVVIFGALGLYAEDDTAETDAPKLKMRGPSPHAFTYSHEQGGKLFVACAETDSGDVLGAILLWKPDGQEKLVDIETLSALDEVLRERVVRLGNKPANKKVLNIVAPAIGEYVRIQSAGSILFPNQIKSFLDQMKSHVSTAVYEGIKKKLVYPSDECGENSWTLAMFVLKSDGAIELNRFYGLFEPFAINKRVTEVIARTGVVPGFHYMPPGPEDEEAKPNGSTENKKALGLEADSE
jgi:hypothetical protein